MLEKFTHTNSKNETLDFLSLGVYANENDLRDYEWSYTSKNNRITGFYKGVVKKTIPFVFLVDEATASEIKNKFYEHFEIDVLTQNKGYFEINGYKYYCYAIKSTKSDYLANKRILNISLEITTDQPYWVKETTFTINFNEEQEETNSIKYPFSYSYVYLNNSAYINNADFTESDIILRIYGACTNPRVVIGDNIYQIDTVIDENEYLEINTQERTIYRYSIYGDKTNVFNYRNKDHDCFKPIQSGMLDVFSTNAVKIDIVAIEQRSEPRWN